MSNLVDISPGDVKRIAGQELYAMNEYVSNFFLSVDSFDERARIEYAQAKIPVYQPGKGFNIEVDDIKNYIVLTHDTFNDLRSFVESVKERETINNILKLLKNLSDIGPSTRSFYSRIKEEVESGTYDKSLVFFPASSILHVVSEFETIIFGEVEEAIEKFESIMNKSSRISTREIQKIISNVEDILKRENWELTENQREVIKNTLLNTVVALEGVPGAGKTTILALLILLKIFAHSKNKKRVNVIVTANTYKAIQEFLNKLYEFLRMQKVRNFVGKDFKILAGVSGNRFRSEGFDEVRLKYERENIPIIFGNLRTDIDSRILDSKLNIIVLPLSSFREYFRKKAVFRERIDILAIDEASQVPASSLLQLLQNIEGIPDEIIIAGDSLQLPPIYSVVNAEIPLYTIGALYNLFTFLHGRYKLIKLKETRRLKTSIVEIIKPFYNGDIVSVKSDSREVKITDNVLTEFLGTDNLSDIPLIRIKYTLSEGKDRRKSEVEKAIVEYIVKAIEGAKIGVLTPFREQENLLRRIRSRKNDLIIGTVDKLQGQDVDVGIISLTSNHSKYTQNILSFIATPNRLNVAFSRAKETNILIHSEAVEKEVFVAFDNEKIEKAREAMIGFKRFDIELNSEDEVSSFIKTIDAGKGFEMLRDYMRITENFLGTLRIPTPNNPSGIEVEVYIS